MKSNGRYYSVEGMIKTSFSPKVDPINNMVCLALAFFGPYWVFLHDAEEAFKALKKWWRDRVKAEA